MKPAHALVGCGAFLGATILFAHADNSGAPAAAPAAASHPLVITPQGPWLQSFPPVHSDTGDAPSFDGATSDSTSAATENAGAQEIDPTDAERIAAQTYQMNQEKKDQPDPNTLEQTAKQQAYDNDWMLRDYTAQLKKQGLEKAGYTNPYLVPEPLDPATLQSSDDPLLDQPEKKKPAASTPPASPFDDSSTLTPKKTLASLGFQPLLPPLTAPVTAPSIGSGAGGIGDASPDSSAGLPDLNAQPPGSLGVPSDTAVDSLLEVPGLTAAAQNGVAPNNAIDLDDPANDSANRPRPANNFLVPTAPADDVTEFFKKQAEALAPSGTVPTILLPPKPRLIVNPEPMAKPAISGLRSHVDDPFDILKQ
jgi:hypothetical protein